MPTRKRNKQIILRLTEDEYIRFMVKVEKSKLSQQEFLRYASLNKKITVIEEMRSFAFELKRIGTNFNQLTYKANSGYPVDQNELEKIRKELNNLWQSLKRLKVMDP